MSGDATDEDDPSPFLCLHALDTGFGDDEGALEVDVQHVVEFLDRDVGDVPDPFTPTRIADEDRDGFVFGRVGWMGEDGGDEG